MLLPGDSYYQDRPVRHTAQGDLYADVPLPVFVGDGPMKARGARKRPLDFLKPEPTTSGVFAPEQRLVVVCNYTCTFVAQPPGMQGYSHPLRQVAPVMPLAHLIHNRGMQRTEARRLKAAGALTGILYIPRPPGVEPPDSAKFDDEFTPNDYAVLLYGMATTHQSVLDGKPRVARLSMSAQKVLIAGLIALMSPSLWNPDDIEDPDQSCSWD